MVALTLWRASSWFHRMGWRLPARLAKATIFLLFGSILEPEAVREGHVNFAHRGLGVVIHGTTVLGDWVQIWQYATIGSNNDKERRDTGVRLGRGVVVGAHAIIMCPRGRTLTVGDEAVIAAGAVVVDDVPPRSVVLPATGHVFARQGDPCTEGSREGRAGE